MEGQERFQQGSHSRVEATAIGQGLLLLTITSRDKRQKQFINKSIHLLDHQSRVIIHSDKADD